MRKEGKNDMIFYFSGTGNSQWVAGQIAALTGDEARDVTKISTPPDLTGEKQVGFVFPIYAWGVPEPMMNFVKTLKQTDAFSFAVCTCGEEAGLAMKKLGKCYPLRSCYSVVMPNNYVIGSDVDDFAAASRKIKKAKQALVTMARQIRERQPVYEVTEGSLPGLKSGVVNFGFNRFARRTDSFFVTDDCISCGLCEQNCPAHTITLQSGRPVWGKACYQCLRCINACPQKAIQYGEKTRHRGRYTFREWEKKEMNG